MRVSSFAVARPAWYDRQADSAIGGYEAVAIAPHSNTGRFSLTVAAGKKCYVESSYCGVERTTVATTVGIAYAIAQIYSTASAAQNTLNQAYLYTITNGAENRSVVALQAAVNAGDQLLIYTADSSTGGQLTYRGVYKYTTYSA